MLCIHHHPPQPHKPNITALIDEHLLTTSKLNKNSNNNINPNTNINNNNYKENPLKSSCDLIKISLVNCQILQSQLNHNAASTSMILHTQPLTTQVNSSLKDSTLTSKQLSSDLVVINLLFHIFRNPQSNGAKVSVIIIETFIFFQPESQMFQR